MFLRKPMNLWYELSTYVYKLRNLFFYFVVFY